MSQENAEENAEAIDEKTTDFEIGGKTYKLTETHLCDYSKLKSFLRSRMIAEVLDAAKGMNTREKIVLISEVLKSGVSEMDAQRELVTIEGMLFMIYRSMVVYQPEITFDDVMKMFSPEEIDKLEIASAVQEGLNAAKKKPVKKEKRATTKKL